MKDESKNATRQAFMTAFCQLYKNKPLDHITVQAISDRAGYNRSTFYQYFLGIDDILEAVEEELIKTIINNLNYSNDTNDLIKYALHSYEEKGDYCDALLGRYGYGHFLVKLRDRIRSNTRVKNISDSDPIKEYLIQYRIDTSLSLFNLWLVRDKDLSADELAKLVSDLCRHGLSAFITM
jgi:AcrR family transcriptional regulator